VSDRSKIFDSLDGFFVPRENLIFYEVNDNKINQKMKIFLTGSEGFIGSHLLPKLLSLGHKVVTDFKYFQSCHFDAIIHLSAVTNISKEFMPQMFEKNIVLTKEIFNKPCRIIYASSCSAEHLTNPYAYTKRYAEYLGSNHPNALGLRFFNVYGPGNNKGIVKFLMDQPDGAEINIRGPELVRDYISVFCVVEEIIKSLTYNPGVYDVGTTTGVKTIDVVNTYMNISGKKFAINFSEAEDNEPLEMISSRRVTNIELYDGLKAVII